MIGYCHHCGQGISTPILAGLFLTLQTIIGAFAGIGAGHFAEGALLGLATAAIPAAWVMDQ